MDELPEQMPEDIQIEYYKSLGQRGKGFSMKLTLKKCNYEDRFIRKKNEFEFSMNAEELKKIYKVFQENKLHRIDYDTDFLHDYDGVSLSVSWNKKHIDISQSGRRVSSSWSGEWKNITEILESLRTREIAKALTDIELILDKSLIGSFIHIQIDSVGFTKRQYIDSSTVKENPIQLKILPGIHSVFCMLYKDYDLKKKEEIYSDFDPARPSLWEQKHSTYVNSLKKEMIDLSIDTTKKKKFILLRKNDMIIAK